MAVTPPAVPASSGFSNFIYEALDLTSSKPSIRLATLHPGTRESSIKVSLGQATFASRPKYEALSYTWGPPSITRSIELNGTKVDVRENLWAALSNLRDEREERVLWIDAICIDQANLDERNYQVELMAYIYARAKQVLIWLGYVEIPDPRLSTLEPDSNEYRNSQSSIEISGLCKQPYWKRVWIVQEIGAATKIEVHWATTLSVRGVGANGKSEVQQGHSTRRAESWEAFFDRTRENRPQDATLALKLAEQRERRHGDSFLLASLMEVCKESLCEEPRDKVYGFVGIAHDCQDGSLPVDYSKSLFELYEDVVRFNYRSSKRNGIENTRVVYFSQLVQQLLGGIHAMEQDLYKTNPGKPNPVSTFRGQGRRRIFDIPGVFSGRISVIGPSYDDMIGSPDATKIWKVGLSRCQTDLEKLRRKNEGFMRILLDLKASDLAKIFPMDPNFAWKCPERLREALGQKPTLSVKEFEALPMYNFCPGTDRPTEGSQHRLFATPDGVFGLMPQNAQPGDMIFQFLDSDTVALVRLEDTHYCRIVGRAVIANEMYDENSKFQAPSDIKAPESTGHGLDFDKAIPLEMDMLTLQRLTESV